MNLESLPDFDGHGLVSFVSDSSVGLSGVLAIHRFQNNLPAFGATRFREYRDGEEALKDALRLSRSMSYKSAMAGLKYGGAKGVLISNGKVKSRKDYFKVYASLVNKLGGSFVTGCDVGVSNDDVKVMRRFSKHIVGTKADPIRFTSFGVYLAMKVLLKEVYGSENLEGKSISIQGVGKTGSELLRLVYGKAKKIYISDNSDAAIKNVLKKFPKVSVVAVDEIYRQKVDVFCPCALFHTLNAKSIKELNANIVCGSANNQLENNEIGKKLFKKNILYGPDYVVNAGGLISVVDEYENNNHRIRRVNKRVNKIKLNMRKIVSESKRRKKPVNEIADLMAEKLLSSR